ncbi:MAG: hypothetical protein ACKOSO_09350 [Actinomycetota bacterium]
MLGGLAVFVLFFAGLWVAATVRNDRADPGSQIANKVFEVGKVTDIAEAVAEGGPLLFPDLKSATVSTVMRSTHPAGACG